MIVTEKIVIDGTEFIRTYSNAMRMIERDGILYEEAIDPDGSGREYIETDVPIVVEEEPATDEDYQSALKEFGVKV